MTERTDQYQRGRARKYIMVNANTYLLCLALGLMMLVVQIEKTAASTTAPPNTGPTTTIATTAGSSGLSVTTHAGNPRNGTLHNSGNGVHGFSPLILISGLVTKLFLYL